jgi:hypothetical protein
LLPAARLHLARGDPEMARAAARRGLRVVGDDRLRAVELLTVLVDAELADGQVNAASRACVELTGRTGDLEIPALEARASAARARVLAACGDVDGAIAALAQTVDQLDDRRLPWLDATLLLDLACLRCRAGDRVAATLDAKAAVAILATLDVVLGARHLALLRDLGQDPAGTRRATRLAHLVQEGKTWIVSSGGIRVRLADTKGLRYLAELVAAPGVERHALDLVDRVEGVAPVGGVDRRSLGAAGDELDSRARAAYRHRVEQMRSEIDDALATGQLEAAERLHAELDQVVRQLARAFGLGGRHRPSASVAERARLNVTRALRAAIARLAEAMPEDGAVLDRAVRTGLYCAYEPRDSDDVRWIVQS